MSDPARGGLDPSMLFEGPPVPEPRAGQLWLSMKGRIPRSTYWLKFVLPLWVLQFAAVLVDVAAGTQPTVGMGPFRLVFTLGLLYPALVGTVKRLHDLGHSGGYLAVVYGGPFVTGLVASVLAPGLEPKLGNAVLLLLLPALGLLIWCIWISVRIAFVRGTPAPNRYGPDPLARTREADVA